MASTTARRLRKKLTDAEKRLWSRLRLKQRDGFRFRRQQPIGPCVVDSICPEAKIIGEVDGGQHGNGDEEEARRTRWLEAKGYRLIRFWNNDVLTNLEGVLARIRETLPRTSRRRRTPRRGVRIERPVDVRKARDLPLKGGG